MISYIFDKKTQQELDTIQEVINYECEKFYKKINPTTAKEICELQIPNVLDDMINEHRKVIKPYEDMIKYIYINSNPILVIKR